MLGYAFYAAAFAVAGALVPRQEEMQSSTTPLTMLILISLFAGFAVNGEPGGHARARLRVHPDDRADHDAGRIILGAAPAWEIAASVAVMILATMALIPLAGRIYAAVVLRTGSAVKLPRSVRLARARRSSRERSASFRGTPLLPSRTVWTHSLGRRPDRLKRPAGIPVHSRRSPQCDASSAHPVALAGGGTSPCPPRQAEIVKAPTGEQSRSRSTRRR